MRNAKIKFMVVGICTLLTVTFLSISCKVEDAAVKEWTITIDPNNMSLGGTLKVTVKDGEKATLPSDIVPPTDYEIPYYSTAKDDYSKVFDFANTAVTSDITVYPHYRYTADKAYKKIIGNWLDITEDSSFKNIQIYKVSANNDLNATCFSAGVDLSDINNSSILDGLKSLVVLPITTDNPFGENTSTVGTATLICRYRIPLIFSYASKDSDILHYTNEKIFNYGLDQPYTLSIADNGIISFTSDDKSLIIQFKKLN